MEEGKLYVAILLLCITVLIGAICSFNKKNAMAKEYISKARALINFAQVQKRKQDVSAEIHLAKKYLEEFDGNLEDFGLTDEKVKKILQEGYASKARVWKNLAKNLEPLQPCMPGEVSYAREYASKAGVQLSDL